FPRDTVQAPAAIAAAGSRKFRLLSTCSRFSRSWPFSAGLSDTGSIDGNSIHVDPAWLARTRRTPRTLTGVCDWVRRYTRTTVAFWAMRGTVCGMSWTAWVTSRPSKVTPAGAAAAAGNITADAGNAGPAAQPLRGAWWQAGVVTEASGSE